MELLRCTFGGCEAYSYSVQSYTGAMLVGIANAVAREFARYRLLVPREVVRDRNMGRSEVCAVPAEGPMQADFFRHQANNQLAGSQGQPASQGQGCVSGWVMRWHDDGVL